MKRIIKIVTEVEIEDDDIVASDISDWVAGHMDNIPTEILEEMDIDPEAVSVGITYLA